MALIPKNKYPSQIDTTDAAYPQGKAQNVAVFGDGSGTPWEKDLVNDIFGFQQALLADQSITPSENPDRVGASQYLDAIKGVADDRIDAEFGPRIVSDEWTYPTPKVKTLHFRGHLFRGEGAPPQWSIDATLAQSEADTGDAIVDFSEILPDGITITGVSITWDPGSTATVRGGGANRLSFSVLDAGGTVTQIFQDDVNTAHIKATGAISVPLDKTSSTGFAYLRVRSGSDGSTNKDLIVEFTVTFSQPNVTGR